MSELVFGSNSMPGPMLDPFSKGWHGDYPIHRGESKTPRGWVPRPSTQESRRSVEV